MRHFHPAGSGTYRRAVRVFSLGIATFGLKVPVMISLSVLQECRQFSDSIDQSICDGCDECGARCTAGVPMLETEFEAVLRFVTGPEGADARRIEQLDKQVPYPGAEEFSYTACRFRDVERGRCSVYPVRPLVCRLFGHVEWLPCPIEKVPQSAPGGIDVMRRYGTLPQKTYEEWLASRATVGGE